MLSIIFPTIISMFVTFSNQVTSRVVDQNGDAISFAEISSGDSKTYTGINGFFHIETDKDSITISALSYQGKTICLDSCKGDIVLRDLKPVHIVTLK
jgi:hypothetical protein